MAAIINIDNDDITYAEKSALPLLWLRPTVLAGVPTFSGSIVCQALCARGWGLQVSKTVSRLV